MVFSSLTFLFLFLPIVICLLALCRRVPYQNTLLLVASILFYAWGGVSYTLILIGSILVNYVFGLLIARRERHRKWWLTLAIILDLSALAFFKYANFIVDNFNILGGLFGISPVTLRNIVLPIGISFYTFQGISYLVDVYRKQVQAQTNIIKLGTYIALFPQLIAGPIIRYHLIEPQLSNRDFNFGNLYEGIRRFCIGLARKVFIANQLAIIADDIFARAPETMPWWTVWIGALCYTLQIYHDFAGYSDMAIGLGRMFGFSFPENFNFPYLATSIREFWRRWHITLSAWFKDYLYIPLGGNRKGETRTFLNLYIVFFLTGLWHGASWTFVVWGLLHGSFMVLERIGFDRVLNKAFKPIQNLYTLVVVVIAWVFFRADGITYALHYVRQMFAFTSNEGGIFMAQYLQPSFILFAVVGIAACTPLFSRGYEALQTAIAKGNRTLWHLQHIGTIAAIVIMLLVVSSFLVAGSYNPFIYFRF
ncbi:MAG: MBOAT family protein [Bacteroidales bacterium]|nr:MBOAT family protein [Bacteroidales bacterium]